MQLLLGQPFARFRPAKWRVGGGGGGTFVRGDEISADSGRTGRTAMMMSSTVTLFRIKTII